VQVHRRIAVLTALLGLAPAQLAAQAPVDEPTPPHIAVESTILVLDDARTSRLGLRGLEIGSAGVTARAGHGGTVRVGTRIGDLPVSAFLDLVRRERAVRRESTQRILTLSGSAAEVGSRQVLIGTYGQTAAAGPALWVEPRALPTGEVLLRVWTAVGDVRQGPFGSVWEDVPAEARTEIVVPDGTPVVIATTDQAVRQSDRGILSRGSADTATRSWVVVRARVAERPSEAFPIPRELQREWPPAR
jgi:hypothetical protein